MQLALLQSERLIQETVGKYYHRQFGYLLKGVATDTICIFYQYLKPLPLEFYQIECDVPDKNEWVKNDKFYENFLNFPQIRAFAPFLKEPKTTSDEQKKQFMELLIELISDGYRQGMRPDIIGSYNYRK